MRIYVTGASGFIGSALARHFSKSGRDVITVSRRSCPSLPENDPRNLIIDDLFSGDWLDSEDADAVIIHCAGLSNPRTSFESLTALNELETRHHLEMIERLSARGWCGRLIFMSSGGTIYGDVDTLPIDESMEPRPISAYGLNKLSLEQGFSFLARRDQCFEVISLRVSNPYGGFVRKAGQGVIPIMIDALGSGDTFRIFGNGLAERDYVAMPDLCRAVDRAIDVDIVSPVHTLNIGSGRGVSLNEMISLAEQLSGRRLQIERVQSTADVRSNVLCCNRAERLLGWTPKIALEDGIAAMLAEVGLIAGENRRGTHNRPAAA